MWLARLVRGALFANEEAPPREEIEREIEEMRLRDELDERRERIDAGLEGPSERETRVGKITALHADHGLINGTLRFDRAPAAHLDLRVNMNVIFLESEDASRAEIVSALGSFWDGSEAPPGTPPPPPEPDVATGPFVCKVTETEGRSVAVDGGRVRFDLDRVRHDFAPKLGDYLELTVRHRVDPDGDTVGEILDVTDLKSLRSESDKGAITLWDLTQLAGLIDNRIFFTRAVVSDGRKLNTGDKVKYEAIESDQGKHSWRALKVDVIYSNKRAELPAKEKIQTHKNGIVIPGINFEIGNISLAVKKTVEIEVKNEGASTQQFLKCSFEHKCNISHMKLISTEKVNLPIRPNQSERFIFEVFPKATGYLDEWIIFEFQDFKIRRTFQMNVTDPNWNDRYACTKYSRKNTQLLLHAQRERYNNKESYIPGERMLKPPPFIKLRAPPYYIPSSVKDFHLEAMELNEGIILPPKFEHLNRLNQKTYSETFHVLLYLEELATELAYMSFNSERTFLVKESEYLVLDIEDLQQRRPSIQFGDSVRVKIVREENARPYEGCIHKIIGDSIHLKFAPEFHLRYNGEDVSVKFQYSRTTFKKLHFAVDLAFCNLMHLLFPNKIYTKENQLEIDDSDMENPILKSNHKVSKIEWFNTDLNPVQRTAVTNILKGNTRLMPYVIFGPPGTGKTVTLVEVIMQIYTLLPNSRLLVATPSNSAATLLLERLVEDGRFQPGNVVRLVGYNYAISGNIPDNLKPYCATMSMAEENSNQSNYHIDEAGLRFNCSKSMVGRHRVSIGTCNTLGTLAKMGFPAGHFTHVLVDEAGQTSEPEVMIALSLINSKGQIVLCGDPLQLGPVVISNIAKKYGLGMSYLERLLDCSPYRPDIAGRGAANDGYDYRLVTKLVYNYRAVQGAMEITNKIFYNDTLISKMNTSIPWVKDYMEKLSGMLKYEHYPAILFHGIRGTQLREEDNPSWFNHDEATMVVMFVLQLYSNNTPPEDIGIITPYIQQVRHIRHLIDQFKVPAPKIGSVEEFQGQERRIIILSTVRSTGRYLHTDQKRIGFINDKKRVNVATSRAQFLLMIYGNPHLLAADPLWKSILQQIVLNQGYMGCDPPQEIVSN